MKLINFALAAALFACLFFVACRSDTVIREDFSRLERIDVPEAGISLLFIPGKFTPRNPSGDSIFVQLNRVDAYQGPLQEDSFMFQLYFHKGENEGVADLLDQGVVLFHGDDAPAADFRGALRCPNGDLWFTEIRVWRYSIDGHDYFEEDMEIARRILESVECLSDTPREKYLSDG